jgi:uncharacterized membrane protein
MAHFPSTAVQLCQRLESIAPATPSAAVQQMKAVFDELPYIEQKPGEPTPMAIDVNADCQSIVVNAGASELYRHCLQFDELPRFITSITNIKKINDTHFSCASVINGDEVKSDVQIVMRVPNRRIAWQAVSDHFRVGVVSFDPLLEGATKVTVKVRSIIEPVMLTGALRHYLRNFRVYVESGGARK